MVDRYDPMEFPYLGMNETTDGNWVTLYDYQMLEAKLSDAYTRIVLLETENKSLKKRYERFEYAQNNHCYDVE
jgi:hypothetical protein